MLPVICSVKYQCVMLNFNSSGHGAIVSPATVGMSLLILSIFNRFWLYSDSWPVAVNSDVKHTLYGMGMHSVGIHEMCVLSLGMGSIGVPASACRRWVWLSWAPENNTFFFSGKNEYYYATFLFKKRVLFSYFISLNNFL